MPKILHFASGRPTMAQKAQVLSVLVELDGGRASRRMIQGYAFGDRYGATQTTTALHELRADGLADFEGSGLGRRWWVTDAGRAHHAQAVVNSAPFQGAS